MVFILQQFLRFAFICYTQQLSFSVFSKIQFDMNGQYAMLGILLATAYPYMSTVFALSVAIMSLYLLAYHFKVLALHYCAGLKPIARLFVNHVMHKRQVLFQVMATNEFLLAVGQILAVFTPQRSLMTLLMVLNFLQMRYMISGDLQMVFSEFRQRIDGFAPRLPTVLATIWYKVRDFLVNFSTQLLMQRMQQQQQAQAQAQQQQDQQQQAQ